MRLFKNDIEDVDGWNGFIEDLINLGRIDDKEAGIAKQVLAKGYDSLSKKQKFVFDKMIEENSVKSCNYCCMPIPWSEMLAALDNGGFCSHCKHIQDKDD